MSMYGHGWPGFRRHVSLVISGGLVLMIGGLGLVAGHAAGEQARDVHRADRLALQQRLAGLVEQYALGSAAQVKAALAASPRPWSTRAHDPATTTRLRALVVGTRAVEAGAVLLSATGTPLAQWSPTGSQPAPGDPGWAPLRAAVRRGDGTPPLSGVLHAGDAALLAMALPVRLDDGSRGAVVGLWDARLSGLQLYISKLSYGQTGHGYVVDSAGVILAGPESRLLGTVLPLTHQRRMQGASGILVTDTGHPLITSYARVGSAGWTALTLQNREEFEGALARSSQRVQALVMALLLISSGGLIVLHRKRETALKTVALHDELTGVYNRRGWFALAEHELARARRQGTSRVLLFVDLDGLKHVNDQLGHREGDRAIVAAAQVLTSGSRTSDLVGRLGGDEFVLLLGDGGHVDVARQRVLDALAEHNRRSGDGFELRLSLGAEVWFPDSATTLGELVRRADADMYADKTSRPSRSDGVVRVPQPRNSEAATPVA
jgi:diguanylate cyclase (GGDEF)-like protein